MMKKQEFIETFIKPGTYYFDRKGYLNVNGDVDTRARGLFVPRFPVKFGYVSGDFVVDDIGLYTLKGSPREIGGMFSCSFNQLKSLEDGPLKVGDDYWCDSNRQLTTLKGIAPTINNSLWANSCSLTTLVGGPRLVAGSYHCEDNKLTTLVGAPYEVGLDMWAQGNPLQNTDGVPSIVWEEVFVDYNVKITSRPRSGNIILYERPRVFG